MEFDDNNPSGLDEHDADSQSSDTNPPLDRYSAQSSTSPSPGKLIEIIGTEKSKDSAKRGHIIYIILFDGVRIRRRYSEFESLRTLLRRVFPALVIPPIPEKHSLSSYASSPTHAHEDTKIILHRQRMLARFLNRCMTAPTIKESVLMTKFLDPNVVWSEALRSQELSALPKSSLQSPPINAFNVTQNHSLLPIPPTNAKPHNPDKLLFSTQEQHAKDFESGVGIRLEKASSNMAYQYEQLSSEYAELGGQFNAFSLDSSATLAPAVERVGQALDTGCLTTERLASQLHNQVYEPIAESVQLSAAARHVLRYHRLRAVQVEMIEEAISTKKQTLINLEKEEKELQKINSYLHTDERVAAALDGTKTARAASQPAEDETVDPEDRHSLNMIGSTISARSTASAGSIVSDGNEVLSLASEDMTAHTGTSATHPAAATASAQPAKRGFRLPGLSHLNGALQGMMDADPQATRRSAITRLRGRITDLTMALEVAKSDEALALSLATDEFARYQVESAAEFKAITKAFVRFHIEWAETNLNSWKDAREAINR